MGPYARKFKNSRRQETVTLVVLGLAAWVFWAASTYATLHWLP